MNNIDKQYTDLLQDILDNGVKKQDRTGTGTLSVFGRQIRHDMKTGFPLLTTKKMAFKTMVTELLWFLRGDTNIKYLVDNGCHIWDGDAYKNYEKSIIQSHKENGLEGFEYLNKESFIERIGTDDEFSKKWGDLGPIYGKQWRSWYTRELMFRSDVVGEPQSLPEFFEVKVPIDQIANLINDLKTNPDSRRLMVNAWNVGELDQCVLPPCHYGFQVYTRELSLEERLCIADKFNPLIREDCLTKTHHPDETEELKLVYRHEFLDSLGPNVVPQRRAISLMWNQRSVDTFLGLPFNIASYGLLLEIIAKAVNMVPDELIGNLGDVHLYSNHVEQAKEQIGRELSLEERTNYGIDILGYDGLLDFGHTQNDDDKILYCLDTWGVPTRAREPFPLPKLNINTEFWPYEGGECGEGPLDAAAIFDSFKNDDFCKCLLEEDIQLGGYQSHPTIKAPLSN
jgi:thymidylate synthase